MKNLCLGLVTTISLLNPAFASKVPAKCESKSIAAVARVTAASGHDSDDIEILDCEFSKTGKEVKCDLSLSKGGGEAFDTYEVILNQKCSRVLNLELTGEE